jgi:hypothetical protein
MDFYIHGDAAPDGRFNYVYTDSLNTSTGTSEQQGSLNGFSLLQNYPNPFKSSTQIEYSIPQSGTVILKVYNLLGQEVITLVNQKQKSGSYSITFDASTLASGIYMYRIEVNGFYLTKKMVLVI